MNSWGSDEPDRGLPGRIGPYRVLRMLGAGGMGEVYLAERLQPHQLVALKVVKLGMDTRAVLARFEIEREALAMMSHTSIARMLDAGATERGQPYFAMEYVPGLPLTEYCARKKLDVEARLDLFLQVCDGVQHAHQKGVIHRDLKPGNILVMEQDDRPVPKIIDFGLARAVDQTRWTHTLVTRSGKFLGTLPYMSPEQADEDFLDVDTRTDIYSLGVVLYELMTGEPPFTQKELEESGRLGMLRILREKEPPTPSQRVGTGNPTTRLHAETLGLDLRALQRRVRGDLDCIALCALEKDRTRRYPSVSALAANVRRHLRNELVEPRPPGVRHRLRKWARRHRRGVGVGLVAAVVLGSLGGAWLWKIEADRSRLLAERRAVLAYDPGLLDYLEGEARQLLRPKLLWIADEEDYVDWLRHAETLISRLPDHEREIERMRLWARELRSRQHAQFVERLRSFASSDRGMFAQVGARLHRIRRLMKEVDEQWQARWRDAIDAISNSDPYRSSFTDRPLVPQLAFIPLGENGSGLWEFALSGTGELPRRAEDGGWVMEEDTCLVFVLIPGGTFVMGSDDPDALSKEKPAQEVRIDPFLLSKYELTQAQWQRLTGLDNPSNWRDGNETGGGPLHPVEQVDWFAAVGELDWWGLTLPTEGQWEYACRASTSGSWSCPFEQLDEHANVADASAAGIGAAWRTIDETLDDGHLVTAPVGSYAPNDFGLHDMHGNVREWCLNGYVEDYSLGIEDGTGFPIGAEGTGRAMIRGGSFRHHADDSRCSARTQMLKGNAYMTLGIRPSAILDR